MWCFSVLPIIFATSVFGQQVVLDSIHNATALDGTWTTGSGAVRTGPVSFTLMASGRGRAELIITVQPFIDPVSMSFKYPLNTGRSFSFLDGPTNNYFEQMDYRITSNASSPGCVTAVLTWQHGSYEYLPNGSLFLTPFGSDGFQQVENACTAISNQIGRYNQSILFSEWRIFPLTGGGFHLNLFEFDGTPVAPMNIVANPPNMLPTQPIITPSSTASANARRDIEARSSASRSMYMSGSIALMVLFGVIAVLA